MPNRLKNGEKLVGVKQSSRALSENRAALCYIAGDAEQRVTDPIKALCLERGVELVEVPTMAELGSCCGIEIGAAAAVLLRRK